jgi:uncharacterized protein (DUF342 family)
MNMNTDSAELGAAETEAPQEELKEEPKPDFQLQVATDNMTAYLRVRPAYAGQAITYEQIVDYLKENGITYGICEDTIRDFCEHNKFYMEMECAQGLYPTDGVDGWVDFKFDTDNGLKPKERGDGTVDFRDLSLVKNIKKGEILCQIVPPEPGKEGIDVYNNHVPYSPGRTPTLPEGTNTAISEDKLSLLADADGCIEYKNLRVNVNEVFIVHGNVDSASGNINSVGSVIIQGDVREGFSVTSEKDISIRGMAEGAIIEAKGNISISNGMNGMGRGTLKAGGNIVGKYFENVILIAEHDIYADVLMNAQAKAGGSIILKGRKASLIGGSYEVGNRIYAKNIGTAGNITTKITIDSKAVNTLLSVDNETLNMDELNAKLQEAQGKLEEYQAKFEEITKQISLNGQKNTEQGNLMIKSAIYRKSKYVEAVNKIQKQIQEAQQKTNSLMDFNITGAGVVYPGTKITIGPFTMNVQNENSHMKFYAGTDHIVIGPMLPSDEIQ